MIGVSAIIFLVMIVNAYRYEKNYFCKPEISFKNLSADLLKEFSKSL